MNDGPDGASDPEEESERQDRDSVRGRLGGLRQTIDETRESVASSVRETGERLSASAQSAAEEDGVGAETVARTARRRIGATRESVERLGERAGDAPVAPVAEGARDRVGATRESVERLGGRLREVRVDPIAEGALSRLDAPRPSVERLEGRAGDAPLPVPTDSDRIRRTVTGAGSQLQVGVKRGAGDLAYTVRNADKREVALWGVGISLAISNPAIAAGYPTYALLSAGMAAGMGLGAYVSSHEDTPLDDVNPLTLGREARQRSRTARRFGAKGAALGAASAIGGRVAEGSDAEEYVRWITTADSETALKGATMASERSNDPWAPLFGGGLGLLYGYVDDDSTDTPDEEFRQLLDGDLRDEYDDRTA